MYLDNPENCRMTDFALHVVYQFPRGSGAPYINRTNRFRNGRMNTNGDVGFYW